MSPSKGSTGPLQEAALDYASRGWPVLPLRPRAKEPVTQHGLHDATTSLDIIEAWWYAMPDANIGLRTGIAFDVLDIDGPTGITSIMDHINGAYAHDGPLSITGKGYHLFFLPTNSRNGANLLPKVDFRGVNGYVVAPPSLHPLGHEYRWALGRDFGKPLPTAPDWLLELLDPATTPERRDTPQVYVTKNGVEIPLTPPDANNLDILEVARAMGLTLKQRGTYWKTLCPFHVEDTPSFTIYAAAKRQSFYCYGCHAWGDALDLKNGKPAGFR